MRSDNYICNVYSDGYIVIHWGKTFWGDTKYCANSWFSAIGFLDRNALSLDCIRVR